jgi:nucleoid-associated protein YgaU
MRIIVVQQGDTLSKIAEKAYGDYEQYIKIYNANPEILSNPDQIYVGQKIRIPE